MMKKILTTTVTAAALTVACFAPAGTASAAPIPITGNGSSAADTIQQLQAAGYTVQLNGQADVPLSQCVVDRIHGLAGTAAEVNNAWKHVPGTPSTVYLDVSCPSDN